VALNPDGKTLADGNTLGLLRPSSEGSKARTPHCLTSACNIDERPGNVRRLVGEKPENCRRRFLPAAKERPNHIMMAGTLTIFYRCKSASHGTAHVSTYLFLGERFWPENVSFVPSGLNRALMMHSGDSNSPRIDRSVELQNVSGEL
jgi:hypothetical protein